MNILKIIRSALFFILGLWLILMSCDAMGEKLSLDFFRTTKWDVFQQQINVNNQIGSNSDALFICESINFHERLMLDLGRALFAVTGCILIIGSIPTFLSKKEGMNDIIT